MKTILEAILNRQSLNNEELIENNLQKHIKNLDYLDEYHYKDGELFLKGEGNPDLYIDFRGLDELIHTITFQGEMYPDIFIKGGNPQNITFKNGTEDSMVTIHPKSTTKFKKCSFSKDIIFTCPDQPYFNEDEEIDKSILKNMASFINNLVKDNQWDPKIYFHIEYDHSSSGVDWRESQLREEFIDLLYPLLNPKSKKLTRNIELIA